MTAKIVITNRVHAEVIDLLAPYGALVVNTGDEPWTWEEVVQQSADADALVAFMTDLVDDTFLARCPRLRIVACVLKGYDNFDVAACSRRKVWLSVVPDLLTNPTAELAVGLTIALGRKVLAGDAYMRGGAFAGWRPHLYGTGLDGSTVGIVGFGAVGRATARRLGGFDARLLCHDPRPLSEADSRAFGVQQRSLAGLIGESDFIIVAAPLTPDSLHLIDASALAQMKRGALLVNVGRGSVVDEAAVATAIADGRLGGYAADVFEMEDWARLDRPSEIAPALIAHGQRTVLTPHLGSAVARVRREMEMVAARDVIAVLQGRPPANAINRAAL
jgi:phosphonate dehydrogenase